MINKNQYRITNNKKKLIKVGKHWVVASLFALALLGGTAVVSHASVTSPSVQPTATKQVQPQVQAQPKVQPQQNAGHNIQAQGAKVSSQLMGQRPANPTVQAPKSVQSPTAGSQLYSARQTNSQPNNTKPSTPTAPTANKPVKPVVPNNQPNKQVVNHTHQNPALSNVKFRHPNNAKGDIDVFYYKDSSLKNLKQYKDYGSFPNGTQFNSNRFNKYGFNIVDGNNVNKFNNGLQDIDVISANPNKQPKKLPTYGKMIGNASDYVNYIANGKVVATGYSKSGKATKLDSDLLTYGSDFTAKKFDNLPSAYEINPTDYNKYNNYFSMIQNSNFGGTQLNIPVELKVQPKPRPQNVSVTVHHVDKNGHTIASDSDYKGVAGNNFQFNFKTIPNYSIDGSKLSQDNLITNAKYPNKDWVSTIVYKSTKPSNPVKPQTNQVTDYVIYTYNGKQVGKDAFVSTGKKGTADKAFTNFADNFGNDFIDGSQDELRQNAGLPQGYKLSNQVFSDYGSDFGNVSSYTRDYGSNQYKIPVITESTPDNPITPNKPNNNNKPVTPNQPQVQNGKIDTKFVVVQPNGSYKVINPTNSPDASDASLAVNGDHVSDYGQVGQTQDVDGTAYDFDTILTPFIPNGYQVPKLNEKGVHGQHDLYDNILNKKNLHFESDGVGDEALEYMKQPQTIYIGVKPIKPVQPAKPVAKSHITVYYLDADANNKVVKVAPTVTGQPGQEFDMIDYEDAIPSGYNLEDLPNAVYFFDNKDHNVDIMLSEVKGRINVNYIDDNNGNTVKQIQLSRKIGAPFNFESYLSGIPSGYDFKDIKNSAVDYFEKNDQNVNIHMLEENPAKLTISTIKVNYMDGNRVIASRQLSRPVSTNFDIGDYLSNLPAGYEYKGIKNDVDHFDYNNRSVDVELAKEPSRNIAKSTITVNYVSNGKVINSAKNNEPVSTNFDIGEYLSNLPKGYEYSGIKGNVNFFGYNDHTVDVLLNKVSEPKVAKSTITVNYVDNRTNKVVKSVKETEPVSSSFDTTSYLSGIPSNYEYGGIHGTTDHFTYGNQTVNVYIVNAPVHKPAKPSRPSKPSKPSKPAKPSRPSKPSKPSKPGHKNSNKPIRPAKHNNKPNKHVVPKHHNNVAPKKHNRHKKVTPKRPVKPSRHNNNRPVKPIRPNKPSKRVAPKHHVVPSRKANNTPTIPSDGSMASHQANVPARQSTANASQSVIPSDDSIRPVSSAPASNVSAPVASQNNNQKLPQTNESSNKGVLAYAIAMVMVSLGLDADIEKKHNN